MNSAPNHKIVAVDPGREKNGVAVTDGLGTRLESGIVPTGGLADFVSELCRRFDTKTVVVGHGTGSKAVVDQLKARALDPIMVAESFTTIEARALYFKDHPPRGWRRILPLGLLSPPVPVDDYAALLIARRFLQSQGGDANDGQ